MNGAMKAPRRKARPRAGLWRRLSAWLRRLVAPTPKLRVVLDTNVLVSGLLDNDEPPAQILRQIYAGRWTWVVSPATRREVELVLTKNDLRGLGAIGDAAKQRLRAALRETAVATANRPLPRQVSAHESDDKFIAAALAGRADFLISDDRHLLRVKRWRGVKIISSARFWLRFGG
jgi:putative PIN family toxin of toxin-antitoxin system